MMENEVVPENTQPEKSNGTGKWLKDSAWFFLAVLVLGAAAAVGTYWMMNKPKAKRHKPDVRPVLVEVQRVSEGTHTVIVEALGTVIPVRIVTLMPRVSGEIVEMSDEMVPGGHFKAGDMVAKIDPADYEIALKQRKAELGSRNAEHQQRLAAIERIDAEITSANALLTLERGQQDIAKREYELLGKTVSEADKELVLRRPQLRAAEAACAAACAGRKSAEAAVQAAKTAIENAELSVDRAKLDLSRTGLVAPFNAIVETRNIQLGSLVSPSTPVANLVGTDEYWVEVSVPVDELKWITIPKSNGDKGSSARITHEAAWGADAFRSGTVVRLKADLEPFGRMSRVLVSVSDPLTLKGRDKPAMILGAYVRVAVAGRTLENVVRIPRSALREKSCVWVMSSEDKLSIRKVVIAWSGKNDVCVTSGLSDGEQLVTSDVATPVEGMPLRTNGKQPTPVTPGVKEGDQLAISDVATEVEGMPLRTGGRQPQTVAADNEGRGR